MGPIVTSSSERPQISIARSAEIVTSHRTVSSFINQAVSEEAPPDAGDCRNVIIINCLRGTRCSLTVVIDLTYCPKTDYVRCLPVSTPFPDGCELSNEIVSAVKRSSLTIIKALAIVQRLAFVDVGGSRRPTGPSTVFGRVVQSRMWIEQHRRTVERGARGASTAHERYCQQAPAH